MATVLAAKPEQTLPQPDERPEAAVVIYDGECRICTSQIARLARLDTGRRLAFLSLHDPETVERYPDLSHEALMADMYVVDQAGRRYRGAEALRYLSAKLPTLWWLAPLLHVPGTLPVWQRFYRMFAKRRYRFGKIESCENGSCRINAS
jgi:predicted DCC family thiol-disulfide oxidoreductase YuxK